MCGDTVRDQGKAVHAVRGKGGLVTEQSSENNQRPEGFIPHRMGPLSLHERPVGQDSSLRRPMTLALGRAPVDSHAPRAPA